MIRKQAASYPVSIFMAGPIWEAETACLEYCKAVGLCVTVTETNYCHSDGEESGFIVGLINYPRFPKSPEQIEHLAENLAALLCDRLKQQSYTIQAPDKTVWFSHRSADTQGIEAETVETERLDAKHESPVANAAAPEPSIQTHTTKKKGE